MALIEVFKQTDYIETFTINNRVNGVETPRDITGSTIYFTVKKTVNDADNTYMDKILTISDAVNGVVDLEFTNIETNLDAGRYLFGILEKTASGLYVDLGTGDFIVKLTIKGARL